MPTLFPGPSIAVGDAVTWRYVVTNPGNDNLTNVVVSDDVVGTVTNLISQTNGNSDAILEPGEIWTFEATGIATSGQYENTGIVTANDSNGGQISDQDLSHYFGTQTGITIEKSTNGEDADVVPGPSIAVGGTVTWTYVVTNTGNVDLSNVAVSDSEIGAITNLILQSNGNLDNILNPGEVWTYEASGIAVANQYENTGTVTADSNTGQVTDQDLSHYFGTQPSIDIEKATNGVDADQSENAESLDVGSTVTWTYVVTNNGNQAITGVVVTDDSEGTITNRISQANGNTDETLDPGEIWTYQATGTVQAGLYTNIGTVTGMGPNGALTANDPSNHFGIQPLVSIEKSTNGVDADTSAGAPRIPVGATVAWTYVVTNPGNDRLSNVTVSDNVIGAVSNIVNRQNDNGDANLDPGEIWTFEATGAAIAGPYTNTGTVNATDSSGGGLTDSDPSNYFGFTNSIDIQKSTNGVDADSATDAPTIFVGDPVTWTYVVTNTGNEDLTNVSVSDNRIGSVTNIINQGNGNAVLEPGEAWTLEATGIAVLGPYENVGSVTAQDPGGANVPGSRFEPLPWRRAHAFAVRVRLHRRQQQWRYRQLRAATTGRPDGADRFARDLSCRHQYQRVRLLPI